ncbi:hypothetical protein EV702DRAFT_1045947 [Suillus placidus]|uniref:Uncharacterized protein n=1 Tax=Suillus placidus TaxID=48579 RepID=A0A9P6ZUU9_9AGAM|nr:hypothetical protein EV702DRAFT_1045947 [Suillus placidus]
MPTGIYKLISVACPVRYVSLVNDNIVGHSEESGIMTEWYVKFSEGDIATFQAVRDGKVCDEYIYFDGNFFVKEVSTGSSFRHFSIDIGGGNDRTWTLTSEAENSPIKGERKTGSAEQLWMFKK